jgi:hypothetical protein
MTARATQHSARILRARQSALPVPPAHRGAMLSSLIWSLSTPSASLPYLKPPCSAPALTQVIKRGMSTTPNSKHLNMQESEDEVLARFQRAVRDESESRVDIWSLPMETLGASTSSSPILCLLVHQFGKTSYPYEHSLVAAFSGNPNADMLYYERRPHSVLSCKSQERHAT